MVADRSSPLKSRTLVEAQQAAHAVAAKAARDLFVASPLLKSIARFEESVLRHGPPALQLRVLEDLRAERERLRNAPSDDTARKERLRRLDPIELAVRSGPDGDALRGHFSRNVWVTVRDAVEEEVVRFTDLLQLNLDQTREAIDDVVEASHHINGASKELMFEKGAVSTSDGGRLLGTNVAACAWLDAAGSLVKVGERLLEAVQSARADAVGEDCHAWCGYFVLRAISVLKSGQGERVRELIGSDASSDTREQVPGATAEPSSFTGGTTMTVADSDDDHAATEEDRGQPVAQRSAQGNPRGEDDARSTRGSRRRQAMVVALAVLTEHLKASPHAPMSMAGLFKAMQKTIPWLNDASFYRWVKHRDDWKPVRGLLERLERETSGADAAVDLRARQRTAANADDGESRRLASATLKGDPRPDAHRH
jgi:hypothetical protein